MKAVQYREIGSEPVVVEIDKPVPGPGQVLLRVTAAGLCHSDSFVMGLPEDQYSHGLPLTLGHEGAGVVAELGDGVVGVDVGDSVAVYGPWGCGTCRACAAGRENYCPHAAELGITPPGWARRARWPSTCSSTTCAIWCRSAISTRSSRCRSPTPA
ncbi:alcohol dehydrogenase catalytic domain-containing protein [Rathayibacter oskolensis]|uniref:alcohol dehydrogenase catalytic domain-containing protein n=1 Tax=Rathayibacter oskolensis TaxID=1891671 RepID=UPI003466CD59